jgi:IS6 family transposase
MCGRTRPDRSGTPFARERWPREVLVTAVRWYGRCRLSLRDVCDRLAERGVDVSPRTVLSWVRTFGPLLAAELRRQARPLRGRWYVDEAYVRVAGRWAYLYRAVDETGQVVDVLLRAQRDLASARAFLQQARQRRASRPEPVVTDKHAAYGRAVRRHVPCAAHVRTGLPARKGRPPSPSSARTAP